MHFYAFRKSFGRRMVIFKFSHFVLNCLKFLFYELVCCFASISCWTLLQRWAGFLIFWIDLAAAFFVEFCLCSVAFFNKLVFSTVLEISMPELAWTAWATYPKHEKSPSKMNDLSGDENSVNKSHSPNTVHLLIGLKCMHKIAKDLIAFKDKKK